MAWRFRTLLAGLGIIFAASIASATEGSVELNPSGPWKIDYSDRACTLSRRFSAADQSFLLAVTFEPIQRLAWMRIGSPEQVAQRDDGDAIVEVDGVKLDHTVHFNVFPSQTDGTVREFMFMDFKNEVGGARQTVRLTPGKYGDLMFNLTDFPQAMEATAACLGDLHRSLNIDPALLDSIAAEPEGFAMQFVDVPRSSGGFDMALLYWVTPEGKVDECRVLMHSGHEKFDSSVCDELKRKARFKPARNAAGEPIRAPAYEYIRLRTQTITTTTPLF